MTTEWLRLQSQSPHSAHISSLSKQQSCSCFPLFPFLSRLSPALKEFWGNAETASCFHSTLLVSHSHSAARRGVCELSVTSENSWKRTHGRTLMLTGLVWFPVWSSFRSQVSHLRKSTSHQGVPDVGQSQILTYCHPVMPQTLDL